MHPALTRLECLCAGDEPEAQVQGQRAPADQHHRAREDEQRQVPRVQGDHRPKRAALGLGGPDILQEVPPRQLRRAVRGRAPLDHRLELVGRRRRGSVHR